jgi:hypothetical protein
MKFPLVVPEAEMSNNERPGRPTRQRQAPSKFKIYELQELRYRSPEKGVGADGRMDVDPLAISPPRSRRKACRAGDDAAGPGPSSSSSQPQQSNLSNSEILDSLKDVDVEHEHEHDVHEDEQDHHHHQEEEVLEKEERGDDDDGAMVFEEEDVDVEEAEVMELTGDAGRYISEGQPLVFTITQAGDHQEVSYNVPGGMEEHHSSEHDENHHYEVEDVSRYKWMGFTNKTLNKVVALKEMEAASAGSS